MKITTNKELNTKSKILVLGLFKEDKDKYKKSNPELAKEIEEAKKRKLFGDEFGKTYSTKITNSIYNSILLISLGEIKKFDAEKLRRAMHKAVEFTKTKKFYSFTTNIAEISKLDPEEIGRAITEGILLSNYAFDKYKESKKDAVTIREVSLLWKDAKTKQQIDKGIKTGIILAESQNYTRNLINEPAEVVTPVYLEKEAKKLAKNKKIKLKVLNRDDMKKLGMGALLAVARGSSLPPKLLLIHYKNSNEPLTAMVGKGITFDTGGYHVKPYGYMEDMKSDMSGAAAILGTMKAISELKLKRNVLGVIPTCENMISGNAYRPGDILKAYNGKTIQVEHTDAEGRLILADALAYTDDKYKPKVMVDIATLTGACMVALGPYSSGIMSKEEKILEELEEAGQKSFDRVWRLPFYDDLDDAMDGTIADLSNLSSKYKSYAGASTAGIFLSKFVKKAKWAHIDIAGTAHPKEAKFYNKKNSANGSGVRLLTYWLMK